MSLHVTYRHESCEGTFRTRREISTWWLVVPPALVGLAGIAYAVSMGLPVAIPIGLLFLLVASLFGNLEGARPFAPTPRPGLASYVPLLHRPATGHFHSDGTWLEVRVGRHAERVYLPNARVDLEGVRVRVTSAMTGDTVTIEGAPDDGEDLAHLAETLRRPSTRDEGSADDVPDQLHALTRSAASESTGR